MLIAELSGKFSSKLFDKLTGKRVLDISSKILKKRAEKLADKLTTRFTRGVDNVAFDIELRRKGTQMNAVTMDVIEKAREVVFDVISEDTTKGVVSVEVGTPDKEHGDIVSIFEYGSRKYGVPAVPTFRTCADEEYSESGKTVTFIRGKIL